MPTQLTALLKVFVTLMLACSSGKLWCAQLRIPEDFPTIQSGVSAASVGDTVLLSAGNYREVVHVPSMGLVIASVYLLSGDTNDIAACTWRGFNNGDDTLRCLSSETAAGPEPNVRIVGIRFAQSATHFNDEGGAIRIFQQFSSIENCYFDSCFAGFGGAVAIRQGISVIRNCMFTHCGMKNLGSILRIRNSQVLMDSCVIRSDTSLAPSWDSPLLFWMQASKLTIRNSEFYDNGFTMYDNGGTFIYASKPPDSVEIVNCRLHDNWFEWLITDGGGPVKYLRVDSNHFFDNRLTFALYGQSSYDSLTDFQAIGNIFERFTPDIDAQMHGLVSLDASDHHSTRMEYNLVQDIHGGHTSFGTIFGDNEDLRTVSRNYIINCSNRSITSPPSGQIQGIHGPGIHELVQNIFMNNLGYAAYQGSNQQTGYVEYNFWGHESGPFDSVRNPNGLGDTVSFRLDYEPWAEDTNFVSAVPEPRDPVEIADSFIGNAYPNPFNGHVTIEFVLLKDQDITLDVYDLTGRHVETILSDRMRKGVHIRDWTPESLASGIYFVRLLGDEHVRSTIKLMFLK